jgi:hypothetical protein
MRPVCLLALVVGALAVTLGVAPASAQSVRGQVLDDSTGLGLPGARVELLGLNGQVIQQGITPQDGAFRLRAPRPGQYRLTARRLGYAPRTTPPLDLTLTDTLTVALRLTTAAVKLAPVVVVGHAGLTIFNPLLEAKGYYDREARYGRLEGFGIFLDGDKLRPGAMRVVDLVRDVPSVHVVAAGGTKEFIAGRMNCTPDIFVNGVYVGTSGSVKAEDAMPPAAAVAAIEVYTRSVVPAEYLRFGAGLCGAVVIWIGIR